MARDLNYKRWESMIRRCFNPKDKAFKYYGGRGIDVCDFLKKSAENLSNVVGIPERGKTMDRIDNNGHYSCGKCHDCRKHKWTMNLRWATPRQQTLNRSIAITVVMDGISKPLADWAIANGIPYHTARRRIQLGVTGKLIFSQKRLPRFSTPYGTRKRQARINKAN